MLSQLEQSAKVVGVKQTRRALQSGLAQALFLARDADPALTEPLAAQAAAVSYTQLRAHEKRMNSG